MRLKSLDIKGFKSFADKTQVLLDHPITGVVGPNGCGKSNIVDAIRWVIGEHKIKSLRSDNLEDLIFNGSRTRARSGMAEVSLTFENTRGLLPTEFTTVTITRRFYKSGESEYRLNDVACRLKDIHNLFLDTGVSNDSYAIIELGMVDDIIKDKEGSRRRMLEQAAGISIYKTRKKEAKQKLEGTESDLSRIDDLLFEIGNNLRSLENQARKAERYLQIRTDYKASSIELAKASLEHFNDQYQTLNTQSSNEAFRKAQLDEAIAQSEAALETDKALLLTQEASLNALQKAFNELIADIRHRESEHKLASQRKTHLEERTQSLTRFLAGADDQLRELTRAMDASGSQQLEAEQTLTDLRTELDALRATLDTVRKHFDAKKTAVQQLRDEQSRIQRSSFDAEKRLALAEATQTNLQRNWQQLEDETAHRHSQLERLRAEQQQAQQQEAQKKETLSELRTRQEAIQTQLTTAQDQLEGVRTELADANRTLDARRNEYALLKNLVDSLEGYPESIKFLKKNPAWSTNAPLLSDIFIVAPAYRKALESVLEPYLNYYIVAHLEEAVAAIRLLETSKKGKANFFLLDRMTALNTPAEADLPACLPEGSVAALDVVEVDYQYAPVVSQLLRNVYICPDETVPTDLPDITVVAQNGGFRSQPLSAHGGSVGAFEGNKIGRAKNLERLAADVASHTTQTNTLRERQTALQTEIAGYRTALSDRSLQQVQEEINRLHNTASNAGSRAEQLEQLAQSTTRRMDDLTQQLSGNDAALEAARVEMQQVRTTLEALSGTVATAQDAFAQVEREYNQANTTYNAHTIRLHQQQSRIEQLKQEAGFRASQRTSLQEQIATSTRDQADSQRRIAEMDMLLATESAALAVQNQLRQTQEAELKHTETGYYELRNQVSSAETSLSQQRREKETADTMLMAVREKLSEMKLQLAGMKERMQVEFKVDLDTILEEARNTTLPLDELQAETDRLKKRLDTMGEVNPMAIEAYTEMKARHDFIAEQKGDLVSARDSLLATIEEVENTANSKFKETFDQVREHFITVFKALFSEADNADLRLTDESNLSESGIEIYAQPKGKKPSTLTQLSGGEKTLTSTAFLFAIYLIKPAPFCILDEVDAPLDDANVGKFTNMIRKFSDNSQFIIVTHNKQTMAAVDVIYGVTMQEPGVSKLVPVDFRSLSEQA
ncbi:MAG: chromosome segregation protein SMC [Sphingobacteriales bacterium]|nr:MAG: chromosome segregation protein SMC [Sphingobacteriales bacterium]